MRFALQKMGHRSCVGPVRGGCLKAAPLQEARPGHVRCDSPRSGVPGPMRRIPGRAVSAHGPRRPAGASSFPGGFPAGGRRLPRPLETKKLRRPDPWPRTAARDKGPGRPLNPDRFARNRRDASRPAVAKQPIAKKPFQRYSGVFLHAEKDAVPLSRSTHPAGARPVSGQPPGHAGRPSPEDPSLSSEPGNDASRASRGSLNHALQPSSPGGLAIPPHTQPSEPSCRFHP